jgi:calcium-translocating P-type ATPase
MSTLAAETPRIIHSLPGRMRVHVPGWAADQRFALEIRLRHLPGVKRVRANAPTGNVLVTYDPQVTDERQVLAALQPSALNNLDRTSPQVPQKAHVVSTSAGIPGIRRIRIPIRGLDRDPELGRRLVYLLREYPGVHTLHASNLTGRLLIEFDEHQTDIDDLLAKLVYIDLPDLPDEDDPHHPLDPRPLIQSIARTIGAGVGLGVLGVRAASAAVEPLPGATTAVQVSSIIGILQGVPVFRYGIRKLLGRNLADALIYAPAIVSLTFASSIPGLVLMGSEALRLLTEVVPRRAAWQRYEERLSAAPSAEPGAILRLESGERPPRDAQVLEGVGTALGRSGLPIKAAPDAVIPAGARVFGGPLVVRLGGSEAFEVQSRRAQGRKSLTQRYSTALSGVSLGYAALTAILTRSFARTFAALLLVNPRTAMIGADAAELGAAARVLRAGVTIVGTREGRGARLPDAVLLDGPRTLVDGWEPNGALALVDTCEPMEVLTRAATLAQTAGAPWGGAFRSAPKPAQPLNSSSGMFDGESVQATLGNTRYWLRAATEHDAIPAAFRMHHQGEHLLVLGSDREDGPLGVVALRPRLGPGVADLVRTCRTHAVELALLPGDDPTAARAIAARAGIDLLEDDDPIAAIHGRQEAGELVAFVSDNTHGGPAFAACDMGIGLTTGRGAFPARADFLAPDLHAVAAIVDAGARSRAAARDAIGLSIVSNVLGGAMGLRTVVPLEQASTILYGTALTAMADQWLRLRGGTRPQATLVRVADPHPERWGSRSIANILQTLNTTADGLTTEQVSKRGRAVVPVYKRQPLWQLLLDQLKSPLTAILGVGAGVALVLGTPADVGIIAATILGNVLIGAWQAHAADAVTESLNRMGATAATVIRDGQPAQLPSTELVPGDVLLLAPGTRVAADARLIEARHLEVDEAALTGESVPVQKAPDGPTDTSRIVLDGSDVTTGTGKAVVFAVGRTTRMGATAAALATGESAISPLDARLSQSLKQLVPIAVAGGALATAGGFFRTRLLRPSVATGATIALAAIPEGLPILTRVSEAGVARRLADQNALVRRLAAVEALGRVDVACADKTGTLTEGHLALTLVASALDGEMPVPGPLTSPLQQVLATAALASPSADSPDAQAHPTDAAVIEGARAAGLADRLSIARLAESPFDPMRAFHATTVTGRLCVKGAPEALLPHCVRVARGDGDPGPLDAAGRDHLLERARALAHQGLRVLMVAEGPAEVPADQIRDLTALGFIGISDPLREDVPAAVRRCHEAGIRVIMITGDHPATAESIARQAGLLNGAGGIVTADDLAELPPDALDDALAEATVIARATPLDKLRIIESLQRQGHTVAMTGDGVNDAPALRLADVGIAMGRAGTEVARQTSDVVLTDDDFATLVEALVEGRSFWHNIRRAVGLLVGGNLGEVGLVVGASMLGLGSPLTARQILVVNMITDLLPGLAVALQQPESRNLAELAREGTAALDRPLRNDVLRRALFTAGPSLGAYVLALVGGSPAQAQMVAFASIVSTQLGQTVDVGWSEGHLSRPLLGAVAGSAGLLASALAIPPLAGFLGLALPTPAGLALVGGATLASVGLSRLFGTSTPRNGASHGTTPIALPHWRTIVEAAAAPPTGEQQAPRPRLALLGPAASHSALPAPQPS